MDNKSLIELGVGIKDFNLQAPTPKSTDIDLPLADGTIYTNPLGIPVFNNRKLEITVDYHTKNFADAYAMQSKILTFCHAKEKQQIVFSWDKQFFYFGKCMGVSIDRTYDLYATYTINYECEPYKYDIVIAGEPWLWNPFNFLNGVIYSGAQQIKDVGVVTVVNRLKPTIPVIKVTKPCTIVHENKEYYLTTGDNRIANIILYNGENKFVVKGNTTITFSFLAGEL